MISKFILFMLLYIQTVPSRSFKKGGCMPNKSYSTSEFVEISINGSATDIEQFTSFQFDNNISPENKFVDDENITAIYTKNDYKIVLKWLKENGFEYKKEGGQK